MGRHKGILYSLGRSAFAELGLLPILSFADLLMSPYRCLAQSRISAAHFEIKSEFVFYCFLRDFYHLVSTLPVSRYFFLLTAGGLIDVIGFSFSYSIFCL